MGNPLANVFNAEAWAQVPFHFWSLVFFVFGSLVGSFLNVCIYRLPRGESVISPPSHCPTCGYSIPWYLNVPMVAWLYLSGKCRNCRTPISPRYFLVELLTAVTFLVVWLLHGSTSPWLAASYCLFMAGLIVATFVDLEHTIIPDEVTFGGMAAGFILSALVPQLHGVKDAVSAMKESFWGMLVGGGILYAAVRGGKLVFGRQHITLEQPTKVIFTESALHLPDETIPYEDLFYRKTDTVIFEGNHIELADRCYPSAKIKLSPVKLSIGEEILVPEQVPHLEAMTEQMVIPREAMGFGDVKFLAAIGAFLGKGAVLFTLMSSSIIGSLAGITFILLKRHDWTSRIPFGPYLALGATLWVMGSDSIRAWWNQNMTTLKALFQGLFP